MKNNKQYPVLIELLNQRLVNSRLQVYAERYFNPEKRQGTNKMVARWSLSISTLFALLYISYLAFTIRLNYEEIALFAFYTHQGIFIFNLMATKFVRYVFKIRRSLTIDRETDNIKYMVFSITKHIYFMLFTYYLVGAFYFVGLLLLYMFTTPQ